MQLNTGSGFGGECHLDANMVRSALPAIPLEEIDLLIVENVGNLVCPAEFQIGEDARMMVASVAEGDDKPLQVPADVPHLRARRGQQDRPARARRLLDMERFEHHLDAVHPGVARMRVSARTGDGLDELRAWLAALPARVAAPA